MPAKKSSPSKQTASKRTAVKRTVSRAAASAPSDPAAPQRIRLQRALAAAGFGSRRQCEELIVEGRVEVDGKIVDQLGTTIDWASSKVFVDGTPLKPRRLVYFAVNKPTGVVTTNADPEGRPRVIDLVPPEERVFPVGRLDRSSEGLILLTNDGDLAQRLAHPRYEIQKVYRVTVAGNVQADTIRQMQQGIYIAEGLVRVEGARVLKARSRATEMEITLKEGKNREIRRILARLGHKVQTLKRIAIGSLRLGEMPTGAYRRLSPEEIKKLKQTTDPSERTRKDTSPGRARPAPGKRRPPATAVGKPIVARKGSPSRPAAGSTTGGRVAKPPAKPRAKPPAKPRVTRSSSAAPQAIPALSGPRTGSVIGADPAPVKEKPIATPRSKDHIVRPRPTRQGSGGKAAGKRSNQGRSGKPPTTAATGKKSSSRATASGKSRSSGRRKKGS